MPQSLKRFQNKIVSCIALTLFFACHVNNHLQKITALERYDERDQPFGKVEELPPPDVISTTPGNKDLSGRYLFIVNPGFAGHELTLNPDFTFSEKYWSDLKTERDALIKGKWTLKNGLVLEYRQHYYPFAVYNYKWTTFLVPKNKVSLFNYQFNKNLAVIDGLSNSAAGLRGARLQDTLSFFAELCFIRFPGK